MSPPPRNARTPLFHFARRNFADKGAQGIKRITQSRYNHFNLKYFSLKTFFSKIFFKNFDGVIRKKVFENFFDYFIKFVYLVREFLLCCAACDSDPCLLIQSRATPGSSILKRAKLSNRPYLRTLLANLQRLAHSLNLTFVLISKLKLRIKLNIVLKGFKRLVTRRLRAICIPKSRLSTSSSGNRPRTSNFRYSHLSDALFRIIFV